MHMHEQQEIYTYIFTNIQSISMLQNNYRGFQINQSIHMLYVNP